MTLRIILISTVLTLPACRDVALPAYDAGTPRLQTVSLSATQVVTRTQTAEHLLAAAEMQLSGEPLAEAMGRDKANYSRDHLPTNLYFDVSPQSPGPWVDLPGFSTAIESYEYSKLAMNELAFESGAGTSLLYGPLLPGGALLERLQTFGTASHAEGRFVFPAGTWPSGNASGNVNPTGTGTGAQNPLGWPGLWPTLHVFRSFEPAIRPTGDAKLWCSISSDDDPGATGGAGCADYECDATTLHLVDRDAQVERVITPGADGFSGWKYALWVLNYLQFLHDGNELAVSSVAPADVAQVGTPANHVAGVDAEGAATGTGTWLGSSDLEGFQAGLFIEELDNRAADWLFHLSTSDGVTLSGFQNVAEALAYDEAAPLRWFPAEVAVTEAPVDGTLPAPSYALQSADSHLMELVGTTLAAATLYSITDVKNANVGGSTTARPWFDGSPFAADDGLVDGEDTVHDRAAALLRVATVNLVRLHEDPASGLLVDTVTLHGATPTRGTTVSTTSVAYTLVALRTALRSVNSALELYSNNTPDSALATGALDGLPLHSAAHPGLTYNQRLRALMLTQGALLYGQLTDDSGRAFTGWNVQTGAVTSHDDTLDAHTAALRGLYTLYLVTGDVKYRARAQAVYARLTATFYDADARVYGATPAPFDTVTYTPLRFALLQAALRDTYELIAARPGQEAFARDLEERLGRLNKLVLDGWDDRNQNRLVEWPVECVRVNADNLPTGGLQMGERTLTGETGALSESTIPLKRQKTSDRNTNCVPEVDDGQLPAALAGSITFTLTRAP
jgi:hypothetical protein